MRDYRLRTDLQRMLIDGFALPLGLVPGEIAAPTQGYTVDYVTSEEEEPDSYSFHIVVSHERLAELIRRVFGLLPEEVTGIVEIGSRDAYRSVDIFLGANPITRSEFIEGWRSFESFLLEDGTIAAGANSEEPYLEVFLDHWKGLSIHVPLSMRDQVEQLLEELDLEEVAETWPPLEREAAAEAMSVRSVLEIDDEFSPDVDELLMQIRQAWDLELNVDPGSNVDEAGRELGFTLWHAMVVVESEHDSDAGGYVTIWATASSIAEVENLISEALERFPDFRFVEIYSLDRVAFDERPDELASLSPRRDKAALHIVELEVWEGPPEERADRGRGGDADDAA